MDVIHTICYQLAEYVHSNGSSYLDLIIHPNALAKEQVIIGLQKNPRRGYDFHPDNIKNQCLANEILHRLINHWAVYQ